MWYWHVYVIGTFDTKGDELTFLAKSIANKLCKWSEPSISDTNVKLIDISTSKCITCSPSDPNDTDANDINGKYFVDMTCRQIISNWNNLPNLQRNEANQIITDSLTQFIDNEYCLNRINGVISHPMIIKTLI